MSLWDDVIIGKGDKGNSSIKVFNLDLRHDIGENRVSYWITNGFLGAGMTVFKYTPEGQRLAEYIEARQQGKFDAENFDNWLDNIAIKHIEPAALKRLAEQALKNAFDEGSETRATEIRAALGLRR